jgi:hypothetical protein
MGYERKRWNTRELKRAAVLIGDGKAMRRKKVIASAAKPRKD